MGVRIAESAGSAAVTSYSDALTSATTFGLNWIQGIFFQTPFNTPVSMGQFSIGNDPSSNPSLLLNTVGGANPNTVLNSFAIPAQVYLNLWGKTQFVQVTFDNQASITNNAGWEIAVCARGDQDTSYSLNINMHVANAMSLYKNIQSSYTGVAGATGLALPANGDVLRLSADFSVSGQVTLTIKKNGTQIAQATDNAGNRLTAGSPAIRSQMSSGTYYLTTFSCGAGL
jgi:hypothetical protein